MKRLFALSLALVMTLSLTACGGSKTPAGSASTGNTSPAASTSTPANPADSAPVLTTGEQVKEDIKADDGTVVVSISYTPITLSYPGNASVEQAVQKGLDKELSDFLKDAREYETEAKIYYAEYCKSGGKAEDFTPYTCTLDGKGMRQDTGVISVLFYSYTYLGGAHGGVLTFGQNYDAKTGQLLSMKDLGEGVSALAIDNVVQFVDAIQEQGDAFFYEKVTAQAEDVQSMLKTGSFYLSQDGLVLIDGQYLLQPYPAGIVEFTTSYDDLKGKLKEEYALTGGSTNCTGSGAVYTLDQNGQLVKTVTNYDPMVFDSGAEQDAEDGSVSTAS